MNNLNLISSKQLIAELYNDYNISNDDWVGKAQRHLARALALMEIDGYYKRSYSLESVQEYRAPLPCDNKYIIAVVLPEHRFSRLPLTRSLSLGINFKDIPLHPILKGSINYNWLQTNFRDGKVLYIYYAIPTDEEGNLLIPNNDFVLEALPYFIISKLSLSSYVHPVISREEAEQKWATLSARARNAVNYPSLEEMDRFTKLNNNPLFMDIINEDWQYVEEEFNTIGVTNLIEQLNLHRINSTNT